MTELFMYLAVALFLGCLAFIVVGEYMRRTSARHDPRKDNGKILLRVGFAGAALTTLLVAIVLST